MHKLLLATLVLLPVLPMAGRAQISPPMFTFISDSFSSEPAPALTHVRAANPRGIFLIGDMPHENPGSNCSSTEGCLTKFRTMYAKLYQGLTPLGLDFKREILDPEIPVLGRINDDHEIRDNVSGNYKYWPEALQVYQEFHNLPEDNGMEQGYLYSSLTVPVEDGLALFILLDVRTHRETKNGAAKTMLGAEQKWWLTQRVAQCMDPAYQWCILVSPVPVNPLNPKLDSWHGFSVELEWLQNLTLPLGKKVIVVSGDCHWGSISLPPNTQMPELNIPQLNPGFSNTCNNNCNQWTLNSKKAGTGYGNLTLTPASAILTVMNGDGSVRLTTKWEK